MYSFALKYKVSRNIYVFTVLAKSDIWDMYGQYIHLH